jgi:hypothetical protein
MADDADVSQARMEAEQERLLAARQWSMLPAIGECHNCREQLVDDKRFCDRHCVEDWEQRQAANKRNGRG